MLWAPLQLELWPWIKIKSKNINKTGPAYHGLQIPEPPEVEAKLPPDFVTVLFLQRAPVTSSYTQERVKARYRSLKPTYIGRHCDHGRPPNSALTTGEGP